MVAVVVAVVGTGATIVGPGGGSGGGGGMPMPVVGGVIGAFCAPPPDPALEGRAGMTVPNKCCASFCRAVRSLSLESSSSSFSSPFRFHYPSQEREVCCRWSACSERELRGGVEEGGET